MRLPCTNPPSRCPRQLLEGASGEGGGGWGAYMVVASFQEGRKDMYTRIRGAGNEDGEDCGLCE